MSLYRMLNGINTATFLFLPMLGEKHPDDYPRFRNCFVNIKERKIEVYTRVGGGNRGMGFGEEELRKHPNYLYDEDDDFDSTYATYYFSIPKEWKSDFDLILKKELNKVSEKYINRIINVFPKLEKEIKEIFKNK